MRFLTQGNGPWGNRSWTYDLIGNRLTKTRGMTTDTYVYVPNVAGGNSPTLMAITSGASGTEALMFDAAGNQTQVIDAEGTVTSYPYRTPPDTSPPEQFTLDLVGLGQPDR